MKKKIRVLIVEDSLVAQRLLTHAIGLDPRLTVVGCAGDADQALTMIAALNPDVVTMDIRLPRIDGFQATRRIMQDHPLPIVVVASNVDDKSLDITMNALKAGALTVVEKPSPAEAGFEARAKALCGQLVNMSQVKVVRQRRINRSVGPPSCIVRPSGGFDVVGITASTGGPGALARIAGDLPADFPLPIVVVQHIGAPFVAGFASWLGTVSSLPVELGADGGPLRPGTFHVAPGDVHLRVVGDVLRLQEGPAVQGQRPAGDVLFHSLAESHGSKAVGIILTGMGEDGARGLAHLHDEGGHTIAEDSSTAIIWGMPGAAVARGAVDEQLPLHAIAGRLIEMAGPASIERAAKAVEPPPGEGKQ